MLHRQRRSGPASTSTLAIAPSLAPVQTPVFALVLTSPINSEIARRSSAEGYQYCRIHRVDGRAKRLTAGVGRFASPGRLQVRRVTSPARRILMSGSSPQSAPGTPARPTDNTNFVETRDFTRSAWFSQNHGTERPSSPPRHSGQDRNLRPSLQIIKGLLRIHDTTKGFPFEQSGRTATENSTDG